MQKTLDLSLYLVLDAQSCGNQERLLQVATQALAVGVSILQLRSHHPEWTKRIWLDTARQVKELCAQYDVPFIVNNEIDIALAVDADGLHIGHDDLPPEIARQLLGEHKILGLSTHNAAQAQAADTRIVDYIGMGPVYSTQSKAVPDPVLGLAGLREIIAVKNLPGVAIGGIDCSNAAQVRACGGEGIAVISAICRAEDIAQAVHQLKRGE